MLEEREGEVEVKIGESFKTVLVDVSRKDEGHCVAAKTGPNRSLECRVSG